MIRLNSITAVIHFLLTIITLGLLRTGPRARKNEKMGSTFNVITLGILGFIIAAVLWWYVSLVKDFFFSKQEPHYIGNVEIIGLTEEESIKDGVLQKLVIARLHKLRDETNGAIDSLREARHRQMGEQMPQSEEYLKTRELPQAFTKPINVELKISDIDVGPLVSFLLGKSQSSDVLDVTATLNKENGTANVYGYLPGDNGYSFIEEGVEGTPDGVANAVATAIIREVSSRDEFDLEALSAKDFSEVLSVLSEYASFLKTLPLLERNDVKVKMREFNELFKTLAPRFSKWSDLQWLAAEVSENAEDWISTSAYYQNLLKYGDLDDSDADSIKRQLSSLSSRIHNKNISDSVLAMAASEESPDSYQQQRSIQSVLEMIESVESDAILQMMGMQSRVDVTGKKVAIVGARPWSGLIEGLNVEYIGNEDNDIDASLRDYATEIMQAVLLVVDNPTFVFASVESVGTGSTSTSSLIRCLDTLAASEDVDIVLHTFSSHDKSKAIDRSILHYADKVPLIVGAGNLSGKESPYEDIVNGAFVVGAASLQGEKSSYSSNSSGLIWAPGENIPIVDLASGNEQFRFGTSYSAAIVAGLTAALQVEFPDAKPIELLDSIRNSSKPLANGYPPIINVQEARRLLKQHVNELSNSPI